MKIFKKTYEKVLHLSEHKHAMTALFLVAFLESSFFPIPPDVLLIAMVISVPTNAFRLVLICTVGSTLGGAFGYFLGYAFMDTLGMAVVNFYGYIDKYETIQELYKQYDVWVVSIAGFTPLPYKIFTITGGAFHINFPVFILVSFISRGLRFLILGALIYKYGETIKAFIDKYFSILTIVFTIILIGGFIVLKFII